MSNSQDPRARFPGDGSGSPLGRALLESVRERLARGEPFPHPEDVAFVAIGDQQEPDVIAGVKRYISEIESRNGNPFSLFGDPIVTMVPDETGGFTPKETDGKIELSDDVGKGYSFLMNVLLAQGGEDGFVHQQAGDSMGNPNETNDPGNFGLNHMAFKFDEGMDWLRANDPEGYKRRMDEINGVLEKVPSSEEK